MKYNLRNLISIYCSKKIQEVDEDSYIYVPEKKFKKGFISFFDKEAQLEGFYFGGFIQIDDVDKNTYGEYFVKNKKLYARIRVSLNFIDNYHFHKYFDTIEEANHYIDLVKNYNKSKTKEYNSYDTNLISNLFFV